MIRPVCWFRWNRPRSPTNQMSPIVARDNLSDTPDKRSIAVIAVVSKCPGPWIKLVEAAIFSAKPQVAATVSGDALDRSTAERARVVGVVKVSHRAFGCKVESIHPGVGGDPQIAVVVLHQILKEVGVQATGVVRVVLVYDEGVPVIAIQAVSGGKPHEAPAILENVDHVALRQAIVGGQMRESEIGSRGIDMLSGGTLSLQGKPVCASAPCPPQVATEQSASAETPGPRSLSYRLSGSTLPWD